MRLECSRCHSSFEIREDKYRLGKEIALPCPSCGKGFIKASVIKPEKRPRLEQELPCGPGLKRDIMRSMYDLPAMPKIVLKAREIMADPHSGLKDLVALVKTDQVTAAKTLRLANSAYYGLSGKVSSLDQACVLLGHKTVGQLITIAAASALVSDSLRGYGAETGDLWRHSLAVAIGSAKLAEHKCPELINDALVAGLLHDAGKIMLNPYVFERKKAFEALLGNGAFSFLESERMILGFDHAEIASDMCKVWRIPQSITSAIRHHHDPASAQDDKLAYICHMADAAAIMCNMGTNPGNTSYRLDDNAMGTLCLTDKDLDELKSEVIQAVAQIIEQID